MQSVNLNAAVNYQNNIYYQTPLVQTVAEMVVVTRIQSIG